MHEALPPSCREGRWRAAEEPRTRLDREGVHDDEGIHPAAMSAGHEEVAAARQVLLSGGRDPELEDPKDHDPREDAHQAIEHRRTRLGLPAQPLQSFYGPPAGGCEGFWR